MNSRWERLLIRATVARRVPAQPTRGAPRCSALHSSLAFFLPVLQGLDRHAALSSRNPRIPLEKTMSKNTNTKPAPKAADRLDAFTVREYTDKQSGEVKHDWNKIGVAFPNSDGKGFRIVLSALPLDGVIVLRVFEPKEAQA